jgi:hypothetical protein
MNKPQTAKARTASCGCGQLTATATGEPIDVYLCSCRDCQRLSGSTFSYAAIYPPDAVVVEGERKVWRHYGDSGRWLDNYFCPTCGNTVYTTGEISPEIGISVGCFTDADFPAPKRMYWASRRHHWLKLPEEAEIMETQPEGLPYS